MPRLSMQTRMVLAGLFLLAFVIVVAFLQLVLHFNTTVVIITMLIGAFVGAWISSGTNE